MSNKNEFGERQATNTRYANLNNDNVPMIVVQKAFGPNGENLIDQKGEHLFSGERGVRLRVRQGELVGDVLLSPFYGDPSKVSDVEFKTGVACELFCPDSEIGLDVIPGLETEDGGRHHAIYLTTKLNDGELVAINNIWDNPKSRIVSEGEMLEMLANIEE